MSNLSELLPTGGGQNAVDFVASGTLPNGKAVILKADGTVEAVAETGTPITENLTSGSVVTQDSTGPCYWNNLDFDPFDSSKFVLSWRDGGNSNYGKIVIGTISGTTITFGTEYTYNSAATDKGRVAFDSKTQNTLLLAYMDGSSSSAYGRARVGTVSGTSITFGTEYVFSNPWISWVSMVADPHNAGKFVIVYRGDSADNAGLAVVVSVTGTALSFGTTSTFKADDANEPTVDFDPHNPNKILVAYYDSQSGSSTRYYGVVKLGTISGTTITFGTSYNFHDAANGVKTSITVKFDPNTAGRFLVSYIIIVPSYDAYVVVGTIAANETITFGSQTTISTGSNERLIIQVDPNTANKFIAVWQDSGVGGNPIYARVGTISGTTITYGSQTVFGAGNADSLALVFYRDAASAGKFVYSYNTGYSGASRVGQMGSTVYTTNLTTTNFIGITAEAISSAATGSVNVYGGINEVQTGLTIGSDYYAQADGTITTTSTSPAIKVGQAISATTINMVDLT